MQIYIASDHAGFKHKNAVKKYLVDEGYDVQDMGANEHNPKDDYPDFIKPVAKRVSENPQTSKGIIFGKSGQGEAITANRLKGVRAVVYYGHVGEILKLSREHNDANILSLAAGFLSEKEVVAAVEIWLNTEFSEEDRHIRRIKKIDG